MRFLDGERLTKWLSAYSGFGLMLCLLFGFSASFLFAPTIGSDRAIIVGIGAFCCLLVATLTAAMLSQHAAVSTLLIGSMSALFGVCVGIVLVNAQRLLVYGLVGCAGYFLIGQIGVAIMLRRAGLPWFAPRAGSNAGRQARQEDSEI